MKDEADVILATGIVPANMSNAQLKTVLLPLKTKADGAMPTRKQDMIVAYDNWRHRAAPIFNVLEVGNSEEVEVNGDSRTDVDEDGCMDVDVDEDVLQAMLDLGKVAAI